MIQLINDSRINSKDDDVLLIKASCAVRWNSAGIATSVGGLIFIQFDGTEHRQ
jgi:hypothetical protein